MNHMYTLNFIIRINISHVFIFLHIVCTLYIYIFFIPIISAIFVYFSY